jgi:hypothetical protein
MKVDTASATTLFICLILISPAFASSPPKVSIESLTAKEGEVVKAVIKLDSAPRGISGYEITVSLEHREVADILRIEFPSWAKLTDSSIKEGSATLKAVDLEDQIRPGAANIELATLTFGNTKQGESTIQLSVTRMDDDEGNPMNPHVESGKLVIQGATLTTTLTQTITATITQQTTVTTTVTITTTHKEVAVETAPYIATIIALIIIIIILAAQLVKKRR